MNNTLDMNEYDNSLSPTPNRQVMTNSNKRQMTIKSMVTKGLPTQSFNSQMRPQSILYDSNATKDNQNNSIHLSSGQLNNTVQY